jgi:hypothetical protein
MVFQTGNHQAVVMEASRALRSRSCAMSPNKKLSPQEPTQKIELLLPASLKRQAKEAAQLDGDGDLSSWLRALIRAEVRRLGIRPAEAAEVPRPRGKRGTR